ncbi:MAG TPA: hypothetical protein VFV99_05835 [Kofleriaceae bacterium]|nr:hypothetical protein [Kofleriaceae bacterium]
MTELSRSLIAAAREGLAPDDAVAARVRAKVAAAVGATAATGAAAAIPAAKVGSSSLLLKLGAALLAVGAVATVVVVARPNRGGEAPRVDVAPRAGDEVRSEVRVVAPAEPPLQPDRSQPVVSQPEHHAHVQSTSDAVEDGAESREPDDGAASAHPSKARGSRVAPEEEGVSLAREVELIDLAGVSLKRRAPHAALEAIKAYERETHGRGQMAEEAAAIAIEARCNMDLDVTAAIERFDARWPESAQRERIQTACFAKP